MFCSNSDNWVTALQQEFKSIQDNDVWDLVDLDKLKPIGCSWEFKTKGIRKIMLIDLKKGRLLKVTLNEKELTTFPSVSSKDSFRIIMALVAEFNL